MSSACASSNQGRVHGSTTGFHLGTALSEAWKRLRFECEIGWLLKLLADHLEKLILELHQ